MPVWPAMSVWTVIRKLTLMRSVGEKILVETGLAVDLVHDSPLIRRQARINHEKVKITRAGERKLADGGGDDLARLFLNGGQVLGAAEGLGVQLVDVFGAGRAGGEPAGRGDGLGAADRGVVAGGAGEPGGELLAGQVTGGHLGGGQARQRRLLR